MIELSNWYQLNSPGVVADYVDNEVVFVNLESGAYYSTEKDGALIWLHLKNGQTVEEIITALTAYYGGNKAEVKKNVINLIQQLLEEGLIVLGNGAAPSIKEGLPTENGGRSKESFVGVFLHKFMDMQDLLLLDPVHEVNEKGWPHANA